MKPEENWKEIEKELEEEEPEAVSYTQLESRRTSFF